MTFPITKLNLSAAGGKFYTGHGVDYHSSTDPYNEENDNAPLRNLVERTSEIAGKTDAVIQFLDDAINGGIIRGNSDIGHSDPDDSISTLQTFLAKSFSADGTIKKEALTGMHLPLTLSANSYAALKLFVGAQKLRLDAGVGVDRVTPGNDARLAYFDAVVAPDGVTSRVNSPVTAAVYEHYRVSPFVDGDSYYTTVKAATDAGAKRILMLNGTTEDIAPIITATGELYICGLGDVATTWKITSAALSIIGCTKLTLENLHITCGGGTPATFTSAVAPEVRMKNVTVNALMTSVNLTSAKLDIEKFTSDSTTPINLSDCSGNFTDVAASINCVLVDSSKLKFEGCTIGTFNSDAIGLSRISFIKCDITTLSADCTGASKIYGYINFELCNIVDINYIDTSLRYMTMKKCRLSGNYEFTSGGIYQADISNNFFNTTTWDVHIVGYSEFRDNLITCNITTTEWDSCTFADNQYQSGALTGTFYRSTIEANTFSGAVTFTLLNTVNITANQFGTTCSYGQCTDVSGIANRYVGVVTFDNAAYTNVEFTNDLWGADLSFTVAATVINGFKFIDCKLNGVDISGVSVIKTLNDFVIENCGTFGALTMSGAVVPNQLSVDGFSIIKTKFTSVTIDEHLLAMSNVEFDGTTLGGNVVLGKLGGYTSYENIKVLNSTSSNLSTNRVFSIIGVLNLTNYLFKGNYQVRMQIEGADVDTGSAAKLIKNIQVAKNYNAFCNIILGSDAANNINTNIDDINISGSNYYQDTVAATACILNIDWQGDSQTQYYMRRVVVGGVPFRGQISPEYSPVTISHNPNLLNAGDVTEFDIQINDVAVGVSANVIEGIYAFLLLIKNCGATVGGANLMLRLGCMLTNNKVKLYSDFDTVDTCLVYRIGEDATAFDAEEGYCNGVVVAATAVLNEGTYNVARPAGGVDTGRKIVMSHTGALGGVEYAEDVLGGYSVTGSAAVITA